MRGDEKYEECSGCRKLVLYWALAAHEKDCPEMKARVKADGGTLKRAWQAEAK